MSGKAVRETLAALGVIESLVFVGIGYLESRNSVIALLNATGSCHRPM